MVSVPNRKRLQFQFWYRFMRYASLRTARIVLSLFFRLWATDIVGLENLPKKGSALLVSNHASYYDFIILGSFIHRNLVFLAVKKIKETSIIKIFTRWFSVIYVDRDKPGSKFFREIVRHFDANKLVVVYPEGTRSRTGKMLKPKLGFVKLAMKANVPIIPVAMKGTYEILPPQRRMPRLCKCTVIIGEKQYISPNNPVFKDIFFEGDTVKFSNLTRPQMQTIAFRIMEQIRLRTGQEWDEKVSEEVREALRDRKVTVLPAT